MSGEGTGFRKASDTRELPETPKQMRSRWMNEANDASIDSSVSKKYGPKLGPVNNPPINRDQASKLLDAVKFPSKLSKYRERFITTLVNYSDKLPPTQRRKFDILLKLAGNVCVHENYIRFFDRFETNLNKTITDNESFGKSNGIPPEETKEIIEGQIDALFKGGIIYLVDGFDVVDYKDFVFDKDGNITGLVPSRSERKPLCVESFKNGPLTIYKDTSDFREFLQKQSDPYKGSQQGVGRTRKHKKHIKKTLRRRKVRRNVH